MTIQEFFRVYEGLWIESTSIADPGTRDQCTDLWRVYNLRVVGGPNVTGNAVDYWGNYPADFYDKIPNTPTGVPQLGDVIIWGTNYGPYGHIAVCTDIADTKGFTSFDQNDPLKSPCHYQPHNYTGVLGWLRPKNLPQSFPEDPDKAKIDLGGEWGVMEVQAIRSKLSDLTRDIKNERSKLEGFVQKWVQEWNLPQGSSMVDVEVEMARLLPLEDSLQKLRDAIEEVVGAFDSDTALLEALNSIRSEIKAKDDRIVDLQNKLEEARIPVGYKFLKSWTIFSLMWKLYKKL